MFGMQAIVGKDTEIGTYGIIIPTEAQLSDEFCRINNLYRHEDLNDDKSKKGYLEDNRRVKSLKLRGHRSDALFMPLSSLDYAGWDSFKEGDTFDELNGHEICHKYERYPKSGPGNVVARRESRVDSIYIPEHFETPNLLRVFDGLDSDLPCVVTQKLHGTSIRIANTYVNRPKPNWLERIATKLGIPVTRTEFAEVYGSHHVIKDANNPNQAHYYDFDLWSQEGKKLTGLIPEGYIVYGELIGWAGERPIQSHYTYNVPKGKAELYVYRVAFVNPQGYVADLSWEGVKEFCKYIGVKHVPEIATMSIGEAVELWQRELEDEDLGKLGYATVPLSHDSPCDEGICVRVEGITPKIWKLKASKFLGHETKMLDDKNSVDMEEEDDISEASVPSASN